MKKNIRLVITFCTVCLVWACNKKTDITATFQSTDGMAFLKVIDAAPSFRQVANGKDSFNVYVNGIKMNGTFLTYNSMSPTVANPYSAVPSGLQSIRLTANSTANPDSATLAYFPKTFEPGAFYSLILTDSLLKGNDAKQIFVKDNFAPTDTTHFSARFIHAALNDTAGKNVDVFSTLYNINILTNVAPGTVTSFDTYPYTVATETLIVRRSGTLFELARLTGASFGKTHAYTIVYKGYADVLTTGTKGRSLIQYTNL